MARSARLARIAVLTSVLLAAMVASAMACNEPTLGLSPDTGKAGDSVSYTVVNLTPGAAWRLVVDGTTVASGTAENETVGGSFKIPDLGDQSRAVEAASYTTHDDIPGGEFVSSRIVHYVAPAPAPAADPQPSSDPSPGSSSSQPPASASAPAGQPAAGTPPASPPTSAEPGTPRPKGSPSPVAGQDASGASPAKGTIGAPSGSRLPKSDGAPPPRDGSGLPLSGASGRRQLPLPGRHTEPVGVPIRPPVRSADPRDQHVPARPPPILTLLAHPATSAATAPSTTPTPLTGPAGPKPMFGPLAAHLPPRLMRPAFSETAQAHPTASDPSIVRVERNPLGVLLALAMLGGLALAFLFGWGPGRAQPTVTPPLLPWPPEEDASTEADACAIEAELQELLLLEHALEKSSARAGPRAPPSH